jgi:ribosomal protein S7
LGIRVLVAFEDQYNTYREVIAAAIQVLRPQVEVSTTDLDGLETQVARLYPRVVISSQKRSPSLRPGGTWVQVPLEVGPRTQVTMETLLEAIDGVEDPSSPGALKGKQRSQ